MSAITCPQCGTENPSRQWACSACGASLAHRFDESVRPSRCTECGGELQRGAAQLRTSGGGGLGTLVDAGLTWDFLPVVTTTCVRCGHMELYAQ